MYWKDEFPLRRGLIYLNHAAVGVWPRRTCEAVKAFAEENMRQGAADYPRWLHTERELRDRLQRLVNAVSRDDIALVKNTSEGLSLLAYGLDWRPGDNIVSTNQEFPSNRMVWESLKGRGVKLHLADLDHDDPESVILALCDTNTRLLTISSVQYASGLKLNLERLGTFCQDNDIIFCVDAIQSFGALHFDAQACHADVVVADGHKWMLGSEGLALFYIRSELRDRLELNQFGWHMVEQAGDFDRHDWQPAKSACRFEPGSPNMLGIHALNASLSLLEDVGMREIERRVLDRARVLMRMLKQVPGTELLTPRESNRFGGIVNVRFRGISRAGHEYIHASGLKLNLERLGTFCQDNDIIFCVDAIQSFGALHFDAQACHADVVVADGHKWMLGSEGLALFYIRSELRDRLELNQFGWHMVEQAGDFDRHDWQPAKSACRFEPGSPNMLGIHALNASLSLLEDVGMREIERRVLDRARVLMRMLKQVPGTELLTPRESNRFGGIVNVRFRGISRAGHEYIHSQLMKQRVICAFRGGGIRFSPHFYVPDEYLEEAVRIVARLSTAVS